VRSFTLIRLATVATTVVLTGSVAASGAPAPVVTITCSANNITVTPSQVKYGRYSVVYVNRSALTARFSFEGKRGSGLMKPGQRVVRSMTFDRYTKPLGKSIDRSATPMTTCETGRDAPEYGPGGYEWNIVAGQSLVVCAVTPCKPNTYALKERADSALLGVPAG
jgi:opacity protein-like surface antigen